MHVSFFCSTFAANFSQRKFRHNFFDIKDTIMAADKTIVNPFSILSYLGPEYFCDRQKETEELRNALYNRRNVTLVSPRRMGKTGLIKHLFAQIPPKEVNCFYVDIYDTKNMYDFTKAFAQAVLTQRITPFSERISKEIIHLFGALRPVFTPDPVSGAIQCTIDLQPRHEEMTLQQIFTYLEQSKTRCYVAFDEFQEVANYQDAKAEATLRSYIQHLNNVQFIFAGSKKHMMTEMFLSPNRPFFQSTQMMDIHAIDEPAYYTFAAGHFAAHKQHIDQNTFHELYGIVNGHTWYMQALLNRLYQNGKATIEYNDILLALNQLLEENTVSYQTYCHLITDRQLAVMQAVAHEGAVREPGSNTFLQKHHLGAYSTVRSAIAALEEKELLYCEDGAYSVYDRFFGIWLRGSAF